MANKNDEVSESKYLFENYGITEWHEKRIMLGAMESSIVIDDLNKGVNSPLVTLARLSFPSFAEAYVKRFEEFPLKEDPAIGYKLYLLPDRELKAFTLHMKGLQEGQNDLTDLIIELETPLEQFYRTAIGSSGINQMTIDLKFIYITRYIDLVEAKRIGSKSLNLFKQEGSNGFALDEKLALLNPIMRKIIEDKIGYSGGIRDQLELNVQFRHSIANVLKSIIPALKSSLGVLKNKLETKEARPGDESGYKEYANQTFRKADAYITAYYYYVMELSEEERALLGSIKGNRHKYIYMFIFYKYLNFSIEKVMDVLVVDRSTAIAGKEFFEKMQTKLKEEKKPEL